MRIQLKVQGVTGVAALKKVSLLIVTDLEEKRQVTLTVNEPTAYQFALRRGKYVGDERHRMIAEERLQFALPEALSALIKYITDIELCVVLVGVYDGDYQAVIEDTRTGTTFPIKACDGVLLTYADPHIPLYIDDALWKKQSTEYAGEGEKGVAIPLNTLSTVMLKQALEQCIEREEYEMAEVLKKELEKRSDKDEEKN